MATSKLKIIPLGGLGEVGKNMMAVEYGRNILIIDAGVAAFNDIELPAHIVAPTTAVTADNLGDYYTKEGDSYTPNFDAIAAISVEGEK